MLNYKSSGLSTNSFSSLSLYDANSTNDALGDHDVESSDVLAKAWAGALHQCRALLNPSDYERVLTFDSPEQLADDLKKKEQASGKPWLLRVNPEIQPMLEALKQASNWFLQCMKPSMIQVTMIWGLLHLFLDLSLQSERKWKQMTIILKKTQRTLLQCKLYAEMWNNNSEVKQAFLDVFVALIQFWAAASKYLRENPRPVTEQLTLSFLDREFEKTLKEMRDALENLATCAAIRASGIGDFRSAQEDQQMASLLSKKHRFKDNQTYNQVQLYQLPYFDDQNFIGRSDVITKIAQALEPRSHAKALFFSIWGLGGIGKTQLALAFAHKSKHIFEAIFWIRAETEASIQKSFTDIALCLNIPGAARMNKHNENRDLVLTWLIRYEYKWLMVFDNVGDINFVKPCFPSSIGSILLTTRSYGVIDSVRGPAAALQLGRLSEEDSQAVFINQLKMNPRRPEWNEPDKVSAAEREAMHWLLQKLDGLPLGIRQCAALIRVKNCSVSKFVTRYERLSGNTEKLVSSSNSSFTIDQSYNFVLHTVWAMSFNMLEDAENRRAFRLLGCLSMISPDVIHSDLFCQSFNDDPDPEFLKSSNSEDDDNEELFERAKDELAEAALIDVEDDTISMHRLVQNSFLHFMSDVDLQSSLGEISSALNNAFPKRRPTKRLLDHWPRCAKYSQHAIALADCFQALRSRLTSTSDFLELISNCCWYLYELGEKADCNRIAEIARSACSDKRSLVYSHIVNTLGTSLFELNKMRKCREYLEEALRVRKSLMTDDKEHVLCTLSNLGNLEASEGHYERALELYMEAKNEREQTEKEPSISLAFIYMGIGRSYRGIRNFKGAVRYFQKAETVFLKHHGPRGQFAVAVDKELGNIALDQGDFQGAKMKYETALSLQLSLSPTHIAAASLSYKLGKVKARLEDREGALSDFRNSMHVAKQRQSEGDVARITYHIALLLERSHDASDAIEVQKLKNVAYTLKEKIEKEDLSDQVLMLASESQGLLESESLEETEAAFDRLVCLFFR